MRHRSCSTSTFGHHAAAASRALCALAIAGVVNACGSGGSGGAGPDARIQLAMTPGTATATLGTSTTFQITLTSVGVAGPVALSVTGAPAGWQVAFAPSSPTLTAGGSATVTATVAVPSNGQAAAAGQALTVQATAGSQTATGQVTLTVANEYVLSIPAGTGAGASSPHWTAVGGSILSLRAGTTLTIRNADATPHAVHTSGAIPGFPHQAGSMAQNQSYTNVVGVGEDEIYCHDHGPGSGVLTVRVQ